jgi:hypothetical protein
VLRRSYSCGCQISSDIQAFLNREIPYNESNTSKITSDLQVTLHHLLAIGNDDVASLLSKVVDNIASEETGSTKDGRGVA